MLPFIVILVVFCEISEDIQKVGVRDFPSLFMLSFSFTLKSLSPIHFVKIRHPEFLCNECIIYKCIDFYKITTSKSISVI